MSFFEPKNPKIYMLLASVNFALMSVCVKAAAPGTDFLHIVFFRSLVGFVMMLPFLWRRGMPRAIKNVPLLVLRSLAAFLAIVGNFYGLSHLALADASILMMTFPLWAVLFAVVLLKEQVTSRLLLWLLAAFVGIILILKPQFQVFNYAGLVALGAGFIGAVDVLILHYAYRYDHPVINILVMGIVTTLLSALLLLDHFKLPDLVTLLSMIGAGITSTLAQLLIATAYGRGKVSELVPISYFTVALSFVFGMLWWDEVPTPLAFVGMIVVVIGCIRLVKEEKRFF